MSPPATYMYKPWPISWRGIEIISKCGQKDVVRKLPNHSLSGRGQSLREAQVLPVVEDVPPLGSSLGVMMGWGCDTHQAWSCLLRDL